MEQPAAVAATLADMRIAVDDEIRRLGAGEQQYTLTNGEQVASHPKSFVYRFELADTKTGERLANVEDIEISIPGKGLEGEILSVESQFLHLSLHEDLGPSIESITIKWSNTLILKRLRSRLVAMLDQPSDFAIDLISTVLSPAPTTAARTPTKLRNPAEPRPPRIDITPSQNRKFLAWNPLHATKLRDLIVQELVGHQKVPQTEIGVITPLNFAAEKIREVLEKAGLRDGEVGTIHTFQGREKDIIIFDTVMAGVTYTIRPFDERKSDESVLRLLNVALTRCKEFLCIFVDLAHFKAQYDGRFILTLLENLEPISTAVSSGTPDAPAALQPSNETAEDLLSKYLPADAASPEPAPLPPADTPTHPAPPATVTPEPAPAPPTQPPAHAPKRTAPPAPSPPA